MDHLQADFCVVGAGWAGLAAAYKLQQARRSVAVVEARNRIGGRVFTEQLPDGTPINWGGTFIGDGHDRIYALARELGAETYRQYIKGDNLLLLDGKVHRYSGTIPRVNPLVLVDMGLAVQMLNWMAKSVPLDAPWDAEKAHEWDAQTIGAWIDSRWHATTATAQKMLRATFGLIFMSDPSEVSLLHALTVLHSLRNLEWIMMEEGGANQDLIVGGMQGLLQRIAARLGDAVQLGNPVRQVKQDAEGVEVVADAIRVRAKRVIITAPPVVAGRLQYDPPLPALRTQYMDRAPAGQVFRCYTVYPEPFWRADGLTGIGADMDGTPPQLCIETTPPAGTPGVLTAYIHGPAAREMALASPADRRRVFLDGLVRRFGPKAAQPTYFRELDWAAEEWTRGDMFAHYAPGVLTGFGRAIRAPCGRIHWAGTETAPVWTGSMEGALRSGERAAEEVMQAS